MSDQPAPAPRGGQVAEIIVSLHGAAGRRGSGYRVSPTAVLTAAHVVEGAAMVRVRFDADLADEWITEATSCWTDPRSDLAMLTITPRGGESPVAVARFGRIGGDRAAVLAAQAVGFPRFKLKSDDDGQLVYRDSHQADGSVAVLSNRREHTLEITVPPPERDPDPEASPWEGMSGAALWIGGRIVGVIAKHHHTDGLGRLAAARCDLALDSLDPGRLAELRALLTVPEVLPDVVPPSAGEWLTSAYQAQVRDIAPDQLHDREKELDELVRFCAGDQPYAWWQAGPWAGKSALMAWFVLHPPAGVDVVSFFVTARLAGQSDSDACTDALIEQLAALLGESPTGVLTVGPRRGTMLKLLEDAANRSREAGRRLLLVIDGLDEDSGTGSSIAALLPRRPPPDVRILVAGRPHPPIPDDVADDHPLRTISPRQLDVSAYARGVEHRAKCELVQLLTGAPSQRDVLGLITAAGGGLTIDDLEELTERPPYEIERLLGGIFGRSVGSRTNTGERRRPRERVYLFTHETLRCTAEQRFGKSLAAYRDRLHSWANTYRQRTWPTDTPQYLLRSYPRMLASTGDLARLVACATDQVRHNRMRDLTGGDALALTEISTTQQLLLTQPDPDLTSLALITVQRDHLVERNANIPIALPAAWAKLGQPARADALAHSIPDPTQRAMALSQLAEATAASGDIYRAARLTREVEALILQNTNLDQHAVMMILSIGPTAAIGDPDRAEALIAQITIPSQRAESLSRLAEVVAANGDHDRAARLAGETEELIAQITEPNSRTATLIRLVGAAVARGDHHRVTQLVNEVEPLLAQIAYPELQAEFLSLLADATAASGDHDRAIRLANKAEALIAQITTPDPRATALGRLAEAVAVSGDHDRATQLASEAEALIAQITDPNMRAEPLSRLAMAAAASGDHDRAQALIAQITRPSWRAPAVSQLAETAARSGDHDQAETLIAQITEPDLRAWALSRLSMAVAGITEKPSLMEDQLHRNSQMLVRARRLLGEALATGSWTDVAYGLARLDPTAVSALADELQERWNLATTSARGGQV